MHYHVSILDTHEHFISLKWTIEHIRQDTIHIQQPSWRPGRYELQNYARNVRRFEITDGEGKAVRFHKTHKDRWEVDTQKVNKLVVSYEYYANQLDAGASYVNDEFLYINPVNCMMYVEGRMDEEYTIDFALPESYQIACQLQADRHRLTARDFDELADSPLIASATLHHYSFEVNNNNASDPSSTVHLWFQGTPYHDMNRLMHETKLYCDEQVALFGDLPCKDYHFLYHILPVPFRHGVEHLNSTVIAMGPAEDWSRPEFYDSFMAISSHELFHLWNVKRIRPTDMLPYDFTRENYSTLGYVYEGVTTYYGDMILLRCGAWSWEQYTASFGGDLLKHISNPGRFNYSVAESSFDTWLDGYVSGIPGRKVSIYTEGMLAAFIADILIIKHSGGKYSLGNVMHDLYQLFYKHDKGYSEIDYKILLEKYSGQSFDMYFEELIHGKGYFEKWLAVTADSIGCTIDTKDARLVRNPNQTDAQRSVFEKWTAAEFVAN